MVGTATITMDVDCMHGHSRLINGKHEILSRSEHWINISYERWVPRFIDLLEEKGIHATFFIVADFARKKPARSLIKKLAVKGHEIASHSLTHQIMLQELSWKEKKREVAESKKILEDISGAEVSGFRGPGYAIDGQLIELLMENGYLYDSSVVPGYLFTIYKHLIYNMSRFISGKPIASPNRPGITENRIYPLADNGSSKLIEVPVNVLPIIPVPFVSFIINTRQSFHFMYNIIKKFSECIMYEFHDFEFMDCTATEEYLKTDAVRFSAVSPIDHQLCRFGDILDTFLEEKSVVTTGEVVRQWLEKYNRECIR